MLTWGECKRVLEQEHGVKDEDAIRFIDFSGFEGIYKVTVYKDRHDPEQREIEVW